MGHELTEKVKKKKEQTPLKIKWEFLRIIAISHEVVIDVSLRNNQNTQRQSLLKIGILLD